MQSAAGSMIRAAALAARLPFFPMPPPAKIGISFCFPSLTMLRYASRTLLAIGCPIEFIETL